MIKAKVNNKYDFIVEDTSHTKNTLSDLDIIEIKKGSFHIIKANISYNAEVLKANTEEKSFIIRVNGNKYTVQLKDKYDELLEKLGMNNTSAAKIKDIKAPMPGLVVDIRVKEGDQIKKGDALVVLQAMKMENILKCPADVTIKRIHVKKDDAIEKNQLIISFN
ncbi:MAG TPA: biotin/lipoyl-containing protein [Bacteroidia bacterium]|nr:biotin/lipoyl-containing protein [Bacteroidia bacterium]